MTLKCERCEKAFESPAFVGYCPECAEWFRGGKKVARDGANPMPGVHACGKFQSDDRCPKTVLNPVTEENVCGLCGSDEIEPGYGFAGGFGLGVYNFCTACNTVLDFSEDSGE
jgi:hypothetical protein